MIAESPAVIRAANSLFGQSGLLAIAWLSALAIGSQPARAENDRTVLPETVKKIFKKHCVECHGKEGERAARLKRPEAGFDSILDVPALLSLRTKKGERYIVPGAPDASKLFALVKSDEMPDEAAYFVRPALEDAEKAALRQWIESLGR